MTDRALRQQEVSDKTGMARSTIYKLEQQGKFPKRRKFGTKAVRWLESEVDEWIKNLELADKDAA